MRSSEAVNEKRIMVAETQIEPSVKVHNMVCVDGRVQSLSVSRKVDFTLLIGDTSVVVVRAEA